MIAVSLITVRVSDLDRALRFYRDQLGLTLRHVDGTFHEFDTGGAQLALDVGGEASTGCPVEIHLEVADIGASRADLERRGVAFTGPTEVYAYGQFARFADPDGHRLVLYQRGGCPLRTGLIENS